MLREDYPRLVKYAEQYGMWTDAPSNYPGLFGRGDGASTMILPNWTNRMLQYIDTSEDIGKALAAGLPNITGNTGQIIVYSGYNEVVGDGVFNQTRANQYAVTIKNAGTSTAQKDQRFASIRFNASGSNSIYGLSSTVQPPAVAMVPYIKY